VGGWQPLNELPPKQVLAIGAGGAGGLLREAARAGSVELVEQLLEAGVSPFEADDMANTGPTHTSLHLHLFASLPLASSPHHAHLQRSAALRERGRPRARVCRAQGHSIA
jgi:hypothetical protein